MKKILHFHKKHLHLVVLMVERKDEMTHFLKLTPGGLLSPCLEVVERSITKNFSMIFILTGFILYILENS